METAVRIVAAILAALWVYRALRARAEQKILALRRPDYPPNYGHSTERWTFDFVDMLALSAEKQYVKWPVSTRRVLYDLRRVNRSRWEVRIHPESARMLIKELEEKAAQYAETKNPSFAPHAVAEQRAALLAPRWQHVEDHSARLETHYQLFLRRYVPPMREVWGLMAEWRRLLAAEETEQKTATKRQDAS